LRTSAPVTAISPSPASSRDRVVVEDLSLHGRPLDDDPLVGIEPVEPRGQERVDRRRHENSGEVACGDPAAVPRHQHAVVDQHREHLLDQERIGVGCVGDARLDALRQLRLPDEVLDQDDALRRREWFEERRGRVQLSARPPGPRCEQFRREGTDRDWIHLAGARRLGRTGE